MAQDEARPILEGRGLTRTYHLGRTAVPALTAVDIEIHRGDFLILQGPSGSGKTTLINLLGLLDKPDSGTLHLDGLPVTGVSADEDRLADLRRDRFGFVFQTFNLVPVLSAAENVEYPMTLKSVPRAERSRRARELLDAVGLHGKENVRPDLLSGGERQRVVMARAIANAPEVVFADEPTANLDTVSANGILDLMMRLNSEHRTAFVIATHDPRVASRARRALTLRDGRIVEA